MVQWVRRAEGEGRIKVEDGLVEETVLEGDAGAGALDEVENNGANVVPLPESPDASEELGSEENIVAIAPSESRSPKLTIPVAAMVGQNAVELPVATPTSKLKQKQRADPLTPAIGDDLDDLYAATPRSDKAATALHATQSELDLVNGLSMPWNIVGHYGPEDQFSTGDGLSTIEMEDGKEVL